MRRRKDEPTPAAKPTAPTAKPVDEPAAPAAAPAADETAPAADAVTSPEPTTDEVSESNPDVPDLDAEDVELIDEPEPLDPPKSDEEIVAECESAAAGLLAELLPDAASLVLPPDARSRFETLRLMHEEARQRIHERQHGARMASPEAWCVGLDVDPELPQALEWLAHQARVHAAK